MRAILCSTVVLLALAPAAHAVGPSSVVLVGEAGDYIASGLRIY